MAAAAPYLHPAGAEAPLHPSADRASELFERHGCAVFAFCLSRLGDRLDAEDAAQATFLNAFRTLERGIDPQAESAWLFTIANRVVLNRRRSAARRRRVERPHDFELLPEEPAAPAAETDELLRLNDGLAAIPEQQRTALLLREWQGLTYKEIAAELGLSAAAVETLIFRARRVLAQELTAPRRPRRLRALRSLNLAAV